MANTMKITQYNKKLVLNENMGLLATDSKKNKLKFLPFQEDQIAHNIFMNCSILIRRNGQMKPILQ